MKLNLNGWKKVNSEKDHSILQNKDGHQLKVLHKALSKDNRKQLDKLEVDDENMMADGGNVAEDPRVKQSMPKKNPKDDVPEPDPKKAREVQKGATDSGWRPGEWKTNLKAGLGLAQGGKVARYADGTEDGPAATSDADATPPPADDPNTIQVGTMPMTPQPGAPMQMQSDPNTLPEPSPTPDQAAAVPQEQSAPEAAPESAPAAPMSQDPAQMQANAITDIAKAESQGLNKEAEIHKKAAEELQRFQAVRQQQDNKVFDEALAQGQELATKKINPEEYWENHSKVAAAIGLALSSYGGTGEAAMNFLNQQINRSIEAQKNNIENKKNLLAMNMKIYGDKTAAMDVSRAAGAAAVAHDIQAAAAKSGSKEAEAKARLAVGQLMQQYQPGLQRAALVKTINSGSAEKMDPAEFINQIVKPDQQKTVGEQIGKAAKIKSLGKEIMKQFYTSTEENTALKTGFGYLRKPGSVKALSGLLNTTVSDLTGTVRQAEMDNIQENFIPKPGDTQHTINQKENGLIHYIASGGDSDSLAKANGIPLDKFEKTRPLTKEELYAIKNSDRSDESSMSAGAMKAPEFAMKNGVKYQKVNGGWQKVK